MELKECLLSVALAKSLRVVNMKRRAGQLTKVISGKNVAIANED